MSVWAQDVSLDGLADEPRWFIEGIHRGEPDEIAAQRAGVTMSEVLRWSADHKFRGLLKAARKGGGFTTAIFPDAPGQQPIVDTVDVTACLACKLGGCDRHSGGRARSGA